MIISHPGEVAALLTAACWTVTAISFEKAGRQIGSQPLNLIRLVIGFIFLSIFMAFYRGIPFPTDATSYSWGWLSLSGIVGFVIGDLLLFQAFVLIGSRISMLMMSMAPPLTAILALILFGERLTFENIIGILLTMIGICLVILKKDGPGKLKFSHPLKGLLMAFGGALGQASGLILSKKGMGSYDAFASTQIRILSGIAGFALLFFITGKWRSVLKGLKNKKAMFQVTIGSFFGPFLGVSLSLLALKYTAAGVAATLTSITPILIIPPAILFFREKISFLEIFGACIAIGGVAFQFI
jgi:drug/metabolite transporter (DMT)-like permease